MSNSLSSKKIAIIAIVAVIIIAMWFVMKKPSSVSNVQTAAQAKVTETATSQTAAVVNAAPVDPSVEAVKASGNSDTALEQDVASVDAQLKGFSSDSASVAK